MGQAAATHVKQHFGLERHVDELLTDYDAVIDDWQRNQSQEQAVRQRSAANRAAEGLAGGGYC